MVPHYELGRYPNGVRVAGVVSSDIERIVEMQFGSADLVPADKYDWLSDDCGNGALIFVW
jgi:hypothetical protein